ncbi:hypothetical protein [Rosistilla oblonga]|uniref:hypothetical protein n=1 Tax=Rosistilla oblonga TaxID=2527990 RepID=UPI003A984472
MRPLLSLLLIATFMLGHVVPHSHAASGGAEPGDHAHRPHVHLSHGHDHDHGHHHGQADRQSAGEESPADALTELSLTCDHDGDAVYFVDSDWTVARNAVSISLDSSSLPFTSLAGTIPQRERQYRRSSGPPDRRPKLPIYLLTASLRL